MEGIMGVQRQAHIGLSGQQCVAHAAGVSLATATMMVGHTRAAESADVLRALDLLGIRHARRFRRVGPAPRFPARCIVRSDAAWFLWWDGAFWEATPAHPITSYLELP